MFAYEIIASHKKNYLSKIHVTILFYFMNQVGVVALHNRKVLSSILEYWGFFVLSIRNGSCAGN